MNTMDVHARIISLAERNETVPPDNWCHDLSKGSLAWRFAGSANAYTWDAAAIEAWPDDSPTDSPSPGARALLERWRAISDILDRAGRRLPDQLHVNHATDEMTLIWEKEKAAVVFGP